MPAPKKKESDDFEVWEENWDIVMMFLRMQTQWTVSMAGYVGMRYDVLLVSGGLFDLYDVENRREVLEEQADDADWIKAVLSTYAATYAEAEAGN